MDSKQQTPLEASDMRLLYEGLTQEKGDFREAMTDLGYPVDKEEIFSEKKRVQNKLNHAMLGVYPIQRREVEMAGMVDFKEQELRLASDDGDLVTAFDDLDPDYVTFLEEQKERFSPDSDTMPMSSLALRASNELNKEEMDVPSLDKVHLNVPESPSSSRHELQRAFRNSMVMMNHMNEEIQKHGFDKMYDMNEDHLRQHVASDQFNRNFDRSVSEIEEYAKDSVKEYTSMGKRN